MARRSPLLSLGEFQDLRLGADSLRSPARHIQFTQPAGRVGVSVGHEPSYAEEVSPTTGTIGGLREDDVPSRAKATSRRRVQCVPSGGEGPPLISRQRGQHRL